MENKYSVLMSVYKKEKPTYLKQAIESMLAQTIKPDEFVIMQDGELPEELQQVLTFYQNQDNKLFRIIKIKEQQGLAMALALGVQACHNEYIARMDSDDIAIKQRCAKEIEMLNQNPHLDVVGSIVAEFETDLEHITSYHMVPETSQDIKQFAKRRNPCMHSSIMMKRSKVLEAGNYSNYLYFEDYDLWIRMLQKGCKFYNIQEPLIYMRTEEAFYQRRGGIFYLKQMVRFKTRQYQTGFYTFPNYMVTMLGHALICLLPNSIRKQIYRKFLRTKERT